MGGRLRDEDPSALGEKASRLDLRGAGLAVLGLGMIAVRNGTVSGFEKSIFRAINDLPQALYRPLWPLQQAGNLLVGPVVALVAFVLGYRRLAAAALVVTVMKLVLERSSRRW